MTDVVPEDASPRLLRLLEKDDRFIPLFRKRLPFFRPTPPPPAAAAHVPAFNWAGLPPETGTPMVDLDVNAGYLSAASSVSVAHSKLIHTGDRAPRLPGYFLVRVDWWGWSHALPNPLGDVEGAGSHVWVTLPTLTLLDELCDRTEGYWPEVAVLDSWTAEEGRTVRLRGWTTHLNEMRGTLIDAGKGKGYDDFKTAYSSAVSMMLTGEKCKLHRPDWAHAIVAQHAATFWRKAFRAHLMGYDPVAMAETDRLTYTAQDFNAIFKAGVDNAKNTVFRLDQTGKSLGSFKIKRTYAWGDAEPEDD